MTCQSTCGRLRPHRRVIPNGIGNCETSPATTAGSYVQRDGLDFASQRWWFPAPLDLGFPILVVRNWSEIKLTNLFDIDHFSVNLLTSQDNSRGFHTSPGSIVASNTTFRNSFAVFPQTNLSTY